MLYLFRIVLVNVLFFKILLSDQSPGKKVVEMKTIQTGESSNDIDQLISSSSSHKNNNKFTQAGFVDCTSSCSFPTAIKVKANTLSYYVKLPSVFQMTFKYMVTSNPTANGVYANIFDIFSLDTTRSILKFSLEPGSNQVRVDYNGTSRMFFGPPVVFNDFVLSTFQITVTANTLVVNNGVFTQGVTLYGSLACPFCVIYTSSKTVSATQITAGGTIQSIQFTGPQPTGQPVKAPTPGPSLVAKGPTTPGPTAPQPAMCCATTSYSSTHTACKNAADPSLGSVSSCSTCVSYMCIDWTIGSQGNQAREQSFLQSTGNDVYFGVGSYGNNQARGGLCYRITVNNVKKDLIVQVVNQGADVPDGNFDLQVADGGSGIFDACSSDAPLPMYPGPVAAWGSKTGGVGNITLCSNLPKYPICGLTPADNMQEMCAWSFRNGLRIVSSSNAVNTNPLISRMCQVACPTELWTSTGVRRSDEVNKAFTCGKTLEASGGHLTRMMDCSKPSFGWTGNIKGSTYPGNSVVIPCRRDGYTRINSMYVPPTFSPTTKVTQRPTVKPQLTSSVPTYANTVSPTIESTVKPTTSTPTAKSTTVPSVGNTVKPTTTTDPTTRPSASPSPAPIYNPTFEPTHSQKPSVSPSFITTTTPTITVTSKPSESSSPSFPPTLAPSIIPSVTPSANPSFTVTTKPTLESTVLPTNQPVLTRAPTFVPTTSPSYKPSLSPTFAPTQSPTLAPSFSPTQLPTLGLKTSSPLPTIPSIVTPKSVAPSSSIPTTLQPSTCLPTVKLSLAPTTILPTYESTISPTFTPSITSTLLPTYTSVPSSISPTNEPTFESTITPSEEPTTSEPSTDPTIEPTQYPSDTESPTAVPTSEPTPIPCFCKYAPHCLTDSDCCPGLYCKRVLGYSSCMEKTNYTMPSLTCFASGLGYGCQLNSECCNPLAICDNQMCNPFCSTSPTRAPSSVKPTRKPSRAPTQSPTALPTFKPSWRPTSAAPSVLPTILPSPMPSTLPTVLSSSKPTYKITRAPTDKPTTGKPTFYLSYRPTVKRTGKPSFEPSYEPTYEPTQEPSRTPVSRKPTIRITKAPIYPRTLSPSQLPSVQPSHVPSSIRSRSPNTRKPSTYRPSNPSMEPTEEPTYEQTFEPTFESTLPQPTKPQQGSSLVFDTMLVLANISVSVQSFNAISRATITQTVDYILSIPIGSTTYKDDSNHNNNRKLDSSSVTIASVLQTNVLLSLFPQYTSDPNLLYAIFKKTLATTAADGTLLSQLKQQSYVNKATSLYTAILYSNVTTLNMLILNVNKPSALPALSPPNSSSSRGSNVILISSVVVGAVFLIALSFVSVRYLSSKKNKKKNKNLDSLSNKASESLDDFSFYTGLDENVIFDGKNMKNRNNNFNSNVNVNVDQDKTSVVVSQEPYDFDFSDLGLN